MPFISDVTDVPEIAGSNALATMLLQLDDEALNTLGKIVAIDLFNSNIDRFNGEGRVANRSNLLFQSSNGKLTPVGLDFYEAQGEASNLDIDPPDGNWVGMNLQSDTSIHLYARRRLQA